MPEEELLKVEMKTPCKCGTKSFTMENYESEEPPKPGFQPLIDREFTCISCGEKILYKGTYPISWSMGNLGRSDVMTVEDIDLRSGSK